MAKTSVLMMHFSAGAHAGQFGFKESNDCVVRALANCADIPYIEAYDVLKRAGRESNKGTPVKIFTRVYAAYGIYAKAVFGTTGSAAGYKNITGAANLKGMTVGTLLKSKVLDNGRFIVCVKGHVFAVIDGEIVDNCINKSGMSVVAIYQKSE